MRRVPSANPPSDCRISLQLGPPLSTDRISLCSASQVLFLRLDSLSPNSKLMSCITKGLWFGKAVCIDTCLTGPISLALFSLQRICASLFFFTERKESTFANLSFERRVETNSLSCQCPSFLIVNLSALFISPERRSYSRISGKSSVFTSRSAEGCLFHYDY